jgi:antitoxin HicB
MRKTRARRRRKRSAATHEIASFTVHFLPSEDGGYTVEVPALEGCVTEGDTFEEAERNAREAISLYVESLRARGLPVPDDRETVLTRISVPLGATAG